MKAAIALCTALALAPAFAEDLVAREGNDSVRLADAPCQNQVIMKLVEPSTHGEYKAASATVQGQNFVACWREMGSVAHLVYEDGDQGIIPMVELKKEISA
ncbi:hypothetical protein FN976_00965 [Caenimonas sedimenti]|uniref:Uncharacterized protein n=1 Tax=Caenimonas sedimenti TaxID=2596921 RepID=A0A562ZWV8_9BURK|nr:hypothetical protein [Caenimonas sedimenti]TWO72847.1 hypothetical protein FN976_00965 [Caenimonas sedimenti]